MLLQGKNAVVYGGGEAIGAAMAHGFARAGARVFLAGRTLAELDQVARTISAAGGKVEAAEVDALDEQAVDAHAEAAATSHTGQVFSVLAERAGTTVGSMLAERARTATLLKRLPTLEEAANVAAFVASDRASAMTGAIVNLTCGSLIDY